MVASLYKYSGGVVESRKLKVEGGSEEDK